MDNANARPAIGRDAPPCPAPLYVAPDSADLLITAAYLSGELMEWFFRVLGRLLEAKHD